jgi:hypothetical protein
MWEKKSRDGSIHDMSTFYQWSTGTNNPDGAVFTAFLAGLNTVPCFAGHCDWRLPNEDGLNSPYTGPKELESIAVPGCTPPDCIAPEFDKNCHANCTVLTCSCTNSGFPYYWTNSLYLPPSDVWVVNFYDGSTTFAEMINNLPVRAVRTAP